MGVKGKVANIKWIILYMCDLLFFEGISEDRLMSFLCFPVNEVKQRCCLEVDSRNSPGLRLCVPCVLISPDLQHLLYRKLPLLFDLAGQ